MRKRECILTGLIGLTAFLAGLFTGRGSTEEDGLAMTETRETRVDTIADREPAARGERIVGSLRFACGTGRRGGGIARERAMTQPGPDGTGNLRKADGGSGGDEGTARERAMTQREDSGVVELPVIQRHYADSTYEAWVSGPLDPRLDSVRVFAATTVVTRREPGRRKRWHIGPSVGIGCTPHGFEPFIGVSVTFSILDF